MAASSRSLVESRMDESVSTRCVSAGVTEFAADGLLRAAQIVGDARRNGVEVREIDVSSSHAPKTRWRREAEIIGRGGSA